MHINLRVMGEGQTLDRGEEVFMELLVSLPVYTTTPAAVPVGVFGDDDGSSVHN